LNTKLNELPIQEIVINITVQFVQQSTYHLRFQGSNAAIAKRSFHMTNKEPDFAIRKILNGTEAIFLVVCDPSMNEL
jgi:hypothetical protein